MHNISKGSCVTRGRGLFSIDHKPLLLKKVFYKFNYYAFDRLKLENFTHLQYCTKYGTKSRDDHTLSLSLSFLLV